jgi:uracil-DNA glycosylase family 4
MSVSPGRGSPGRGSPGDSGWPGDLATASTPRARDAADVRRLAGNATLDGLTARSSVCRACPRLVSWREEVATVRRRSFAEEPYWGRPVPGWGDPAARIVIVGLAPAAHGGNRTGRIFTGDRSGDWLFAALHRAGLAALPTSLHADDGQRLIGVRMAAAVRCAPPANKPTTTERDTCRPWLARELDLVAPTMRVLVVLGAFGWQALLPCLTEAGYALPRPTPRFGHRAAFEVADADGRVLSILGCYHPSQQNTFTGKLTEAMLDDIFAVAKATAGAGAARGAG